MSATATTGPTAPFGRLLTAMVTPFQADGSLDLDAAQAVATHLADSGHDGIVLSGTTGEAPTTSVAEDGELLAAVLEAVGERVDVVAGVGTNATAHSVELAEQAQRLGADGILLVTPYYSKPSAGGVLAHFRAVMDAGSMPTMLYDVPSRTGIPIPMSVLEELAGDERAVAVKDASGDLPRAAALARLGYAVYSGDDANTLGYLAHGACGLVSVVGHVAGERLAAMMQHFWAGDHAQALEEFAALEPAFHGVMGVPNYGATTAKAALQLRGVLDNRRVRLPLQELSDAEVADLRVSLDRSGLLS